MQLFTNGPEILGACGPTFHVEHGQGFHLILEGHARPVPVTICPMKPAYGFGGNLGARRGQLQIRGGRVVRRALSRREIAELADAM